MIYQGAANPRTGVQIYPGLEAGGEAPQPGNPGWAMIMNGKEPFAIDAPVLGGMGFENPNWDWRTFDFDRDVELLDAKLFGMLNAVESRSARLQEARRQADRLSRLERPGRDAAADARLLEQRAGVRGQVDGRRRRRVHRRVRAPATCCRAWATAAAAWAPIRPTGSARWRVGSRRARRRRASSRTATTAGQDRDDAAALPAP